MRPNPLQFSLPTRKKVQALLQTLYDQYAEQNDEVSAAAIGAAMNMFSSNGPGNRYERRDPAYVQLNNEIRALHEQGKSIGEIADQLNEEYAKVRYRMLNVMELEPHKKGRGVPRSEEAVEVDQRMLAMYQGGQSITEIADRYGVSRQRVDQRLSKMLGGSYRGRIPRQDRHDVISIAEDTDALTRALRRRDGSKHE